MNADGWYDSDELTLRFKAILSLLLDSEQNGYRISRDSQFIITDECLFLFEHEDVPMEREEFAALLKDTAVRLFRQLRYEEADVRYHMASLFDTSDITLVSNRATCMFNLKKYERCIDLCYACMMSFPTVIFKDTLFYMKLIVRIGHANLELRNYKEARQNYRSLSILKRHIEVKCMIDIDDEQFQAIEVPFQRHLEAVIEIYEGSHPGKPIVDFAKRRTPYELGVDGFLHENFEMSMAMGAEEYVEDIVHYDEGSNNEADENSAAQDNIIGTIEPAHLCCHVWYDGTGPCVHALQDEESVGTNMKERKKRTTNDSDVSADQETDEEEDGGSETDEGMPELVSSDSDEYESANEDDSSGSGERNGANFENIALDVGKDTLPVTDQQTDSNSQPACSTQCAHSCPTSDNFEALAGSVRKKCETRADFEALREELRARRGKRPVSQQGFKKGFLDNPRSKGDDQTARPEASIPSRCEAREQSNSAKSTRSAIAYETDEEEDPVSERRNLMAVAKIVKEARKGLPELPKYGLKHLRQLFVDVYGEKFITTMAIDSLDFVFLFGEHETRAKSGKKKKRGCDRRCATCFARKMWKLRFTNRDVRFMDSYLDRLRADPRLDRSTFLSEELWQSVGYYASGYELGYDMPALVHGVAYLSLLQSELKWRGDVFHLDEDMQFIFLTALEKNLTISSFGVNLLFKVIYMLRDTVTLFDMFAQQKSRGLTRSFQFANSASEVVMGLQNSFGPTSGSTADRNALLMTRHIDCLKNMSNWGSLGHVEREEVWVYKSLLRDVSGILTKFTSRMTASPRTVESKETFSEAFRRLCGDRNDDEIHWKHRVLSALCMQRCRVMERGAASRKMADLGRSATLLSKVLMVRKHQPRLHYKRADVYAHQKKWGECLKDLHTTKMLLGEQLTVKETIDILDPAGRLLLLHAYTLEGEAYSALCRKPGKDQRECIRLGVECFSKALETYPKSKRTKASLHKKLHALLSLEDELEHNPPAVHLGSDQPSTSVSVRDARVPEMPDDRNTGHLEVSEGEISEPSSEDEAQDKIASNPFAALLGNGASSSSEPSSGTTEHPRRCELCKVTFWSEADHYAHMSGKRHKSMLGKTWKQNLVSEANERSSSPGTRPGPTQNEVVEHVRRIIAGLGGQAKLSDITVRLNLRRWRIRDATSYIDNIYGGILTLCKEYPNVLQLGAGSSADLILSLRRTGSAVSDSAQWRYRNNRSMAVGSMDSRGKTRLSETADFSKMVTDLLKIDSNKETKIKSDEEECGICLDNKPDVRCWPCGHVWCDPCMKLYLAKKGTAKGVECPKCRGTIEYVNRIAVD